MQRPPRQVGNKWSHQQSAYCVSEGAGFFDNQETIKVLLDLYRVLWKKKIEAALVDLPKKALYPSRAGIARIVGQDYWEPLGRVVSNELTVSFFDAISKYISIAKTIGRFELRKWMSMDYTNELSNRMRNEERFLVVYILPMSHILQGISQKTKSQQHCCYINFVYILTAVPHVTTP